MLSPDKIPTPLIDRSGLQPIEIVPLAEPGRFGSLRLMSQIARFGGRMMWGKLTRRSDPAGDAVALRRFFEGMGGLWIKAGQLLSLRTDLLSREMVDELSNLTFQAKGFEPQLARGVVESSLGRPIEEVFSYWEEMPFAAASVSQVHRANLRGSDELVAVKVQRPGIEALFARDLKLIAGLAGLMDKIPSQSFAKWDGFVRELTEMMKEEIDYRYEAANLRRMRKQLKRHGRVIVPRIERKLCSQRLLVMEFIDGVLMADYLAVKRSDPARLRVWEGENGVNPRRVASRLLRSFYRQLFEENLFHGDLHPGNIMLLRNNRVAFIDLGTVGNLEKRFVRGFRNTYRSFSEGDFSKGVDYHLGMLDTVPPIDIAQYRAEMVVRLREWEARSHLDGLTAYERSFTGGASMALSEVMFKYRTTNNWQMLRLVRSLNTMDANTNALLGNADPKKIWRKYFDQAEQRSIKNLTKGGLKKAAGAISEGAESATMLSDLLRRQSIVFQGTQSKISYIIGTILSVVKVAIIAVGLFLLYDFLHHHVNGLVNWFHNRDGLIGGMVEQTPALPRVYALLALVGVVLLFVLVSRLAKRAMAPAVRLPNGRLDSA